MTAFQPAAAALVAAAVTRQPTAALLAACNEDICMAAIWSSQTALPLQCTADVHLAHWLPDITGLALQAIVGDLRYLRVQ